MSQSADQDIAALAKGGRTNIAGFFVRLIARIGEADAHVGVTTADFHEFLVECGDHLGGVELSRRRPWGNRIASDLGTRVLQRDVARHRDFARLRGRVGNT